MPLRPTALVLALALAPAPGPQAPEIPAFARELPTIASGEPVFAFNGKDLTGFYVSLRDHGYSDPKGVFTVRDGQIRVSGEEFGALTTCGNFRDYHLIVEWRWGEQTWPPRQANARDSGILLHGVGAEGAAGNGWLESIECQMIEGGTCDLLLVGGRSKPHLTCEVRTGPDGQPYYQKGATPQTRDSGRFNWWGRDPGWKDALGFKGRQDVEAPLGQWNRLEVVCDGDSIVNILNGLVVNVGTKSSHVEGKLQFQSEGAEVVFRKIEIRPLRK